MKIDLIAGARPNFMKIAPIIDAILEEKAKGTDIHFRLIHTGQHYDKNMSDSFFVQLGIPQPNVNLGAGGGTQAEQTAAIMIGYEKLLLSERSDICLVVGDVTSTMACAIVAQKLQIPVAHVEAGIRSGDWTMPEEINRLVTDSITNYFFTTGGQLKRRLLGFDDYYSKLFTDMMSSMRPNYFRHAINTIVNWQRTENNPKIIQIHGTKDRLMPVSLIDAKYIIKDGSHAMVLTRAEEINLILNEVFND